MGRKDVEEILEKNPNKWFTVKELSELTGIGTASIRRVLKQNMGSFIECHHDGVKMLAKAKTAGTGHNSGYNSRASISHNVDYAKESEGAKV